MGAQRILQAALVVAFGTAGSAAFADEPPRIERDERIAVIDLGPAVEQRNVREHLARRIEEAGFDAVIGDGIEDALAGLDLERDAITLAAALAEAQRAYGVHDCKAAVTAARTAAGIGAMRQAAGRAVPELAAAWTYLLLCADRTGDVDAAMTAAARLRTLGLSSAQTGDVPPYLWGKYPEVDTLVDRELLPLQITADVPDAVVWVDYTLVGKAPVDVRLPAGEHVIAVAAGTRRGWAAGTVDAAQRTFQVPTTEQAGRWSVIAKRVATWNGTRPSPAELGWVLGKARARVALVRTGDRIEAWGSAGRAEEQRLLGGEDGVGTLDEVDRVLAVIADRVAAWNDRAPDPDMPLLVEDRAKREADRNPPTKWWVYAAVIGALAASAAVVYAREVGDDRQRVELTLPPVQP